jgi:hypothetical protein
MRSTLNQTYLDLRVLLSRVHFTDMKNRHAKVDLEQFAVGCGWRQ